MKIIVLSDSHGNTQALVDAVYNENPQLILHLGDHEKDCHKLREVFPQITLRAVRGNCDLHPQEPEYDEFVVENKRVFMTHGHLYGVKTGFDAILNSAMGRGADILLFGHTHIPYQKTVQGLLAVNPGSIGAAQKTYAVLEIEHGAVKCNIVGL